MSENTPDRELTTEVTTVDLDVPTSVQDAGIEERLIRIEQDLRKLLGRDKKGFEETLGMIVRTAIDHQIDAPTLYRYRIDQLDPDEKTAIGKRIERQIRFEFGLAKGDKLDVKLGGEDVDIKTSLKLSRGNWMFAPSNTGHIIFLLAYDEEQALLSLGLAYISESDLGAQNRDKKRGLKVRDNIRWMLRNHSYPPNFLGLLPDETLKAITAPKTGMKRVMELLRRVTGVPIPRHAILSVGNQKDAMRRLRSNGGARDVLWEEGFLVLAGAFKADQEIAEATINQSLGDDQMLTFHESDTRLTPELIERYRSYHKLPERHEPVAS